MATKESVILWKSGQTCLQTVDEGGRVRSSYCGRLALGSVEQLCRDRGIRLEVWQASGGRSPLPCQCLSRASSQREDTSRPLISDAAREQLR